MKLTECYSQLEGDYVGVLGRLMKESLVSKFLIMFLKDTQYNEFRDALKDENWETAFRNIHTLKGTALNLGLTKLAEAASTLTELLRGGSPSGDLEAPVELLSLEYKHTIETIEEYSANPEM
ncbi:MAG: Hpt domain-containing protein [Lachnospiraceae bacterium]|nr:Hpt domain-containing protein [Lachnospiraceae bacterium]